MPIPRSQGRVIGWVSGASLKEAPCGAPLILAGPYRFVSHPNYLVVAGEIAVLPLVFGLWQVALLFTLLNAAILAIRIRAEDRALGR